MVETASELDQEIGGVIDLGATEAPENKEKVFLKPGFHKMKIESFTYDKEEVGKTPNIIMKLTKEDGDGNVIELNENLYLSGKLTVKNGKSIMTSVVRLQELYKGVTGKEKMTIQPSKYKYLKKDLDGTETNYIIPNPREICDYLQKECAGKTAVFKVGGEVTDDGTVFSKLTYTGFLYWTDKKGNLCRYKEERDFTESEYKYAVQKRKPSPGAPAHSNGVADTKKLDELA